MRKPCYTKRFQKDVEKAKKQGKNIQKLKAVLQLLVEGKPLPRKYSNHRLKGEYADCSECHIEPDWLLIYIKTTKTDITFVRTGSHAELFR
ncbi:MAG: type II toxin-antitoxin system YafQ family toxin [Bacteroidota bacterium]